MSRARADPATGGSPGSGPAAPAPTLGARWAWLGRLRDRFSRMPGGRLTWRILIAVLGAIIVALGVLLLALPGPGWVIIFAGLGVWAVEFEWAGRLLTWARRQVSGWTAWLRTKPRWLQAVVGVLSLLFLAAVALAAFWLVKQL